MRHARPTAGKAGRFTYGTGWKSPGSISSKRIPSRQKNCLKAFVQAVRRVQSILVASAPAPHLVPEVNTVRFFAESGQLSAQEQRVPFVIRKWAENFRVFH